MVTAEQLASAIDATETLAASWPSADASALHDGLVARGWTHDTEESDLVQSYERRFPGSGIAVAVALADAVCLPPRRDEVARFEAVLAHPIGDDERLVPAADVPAEVLEAVARDLVGAMRPPSSG